MQGFDIRLSPRVGFSTELQDRLKEVPCVRKAKVAEIRRLLDSGSWHPESESIAERILCEHLSDPAPIRPPACCKPEG